MVRYSVSQQGRTFIHGKSIDESLRASIIIEEIFVEGGDPASGYFGRRYKEVIDRQT